MNKVILMGRLTRDPEVRYTNGEEPVAVARFTLAVNRKYRSEDSEQQADFISCAAFKKQAEFIEKYCMKGTKIVVEGRIQTGSYTNREGIKIYTTDVIIENLEFAESREAAKSSGTYREPEGAADSKDGFMNIPDDIDDDGLPFH